MSTRRLDVGDGTAVAVAELTGAADGPTVAVLGGVHGDELEGILAVRRLVGTFRPVAGRVLAVAVANPPAHAASARTSPVDGGNLARAFPGRSGGTVTERIADALTRHVIAAADLLVDLHSAGRHYAMPFFAGYCEPSGAAAAHAFGAPLVWAHDRVNPGRSLAAAAAHGVAAIYVEGSGGAALRRSEVDGYTDGVLRVLGQLGVAADPPAPAPVRRVVQGGDGDVDASVSAAVAGWCVTAVTAGDVVAAGTLVAEIVDEAGRVVQPVRAPRDGIVMMLRRTAVVAPGDGIAMLGPVPQELS
ncbi:succinylglutamate desuccinylase/aspartoacylase family protein [Dactylosporangium fulvum]|uniref:Succinylglutamate desuccinylase/aspartoacylase family protein n=1 Tax=Dactylosporangium fulvum TaxID=53359 RepID=A0ABY5VRS7_9ACTN|nr:succinylglutamate desuccinylase/aspartoacylase family protein [Dactylosporangium fulvum]UWP79995.1 succinylglutamate desuccinylase/aspartoacylase family protein [Dactylosporangium fulvum]